MKLVKKASQDFFDKLKNTQSKALRVFIFDSVLTSAF